MGEFGPPARAAADWLARALDEGGGLVRHAPGEFGLAQQGWRDTIDAAGDADGGGFLRADGTNPAPPLADIDTQAVAVAALRALVGLTGDPEWSRRLAALRARLSALPLETMAVEAGAARARPAHGAPGESAARRGGDVVVPGAGSQLGWLLWADAVEDPARYAGALVRAGHPHGLRPANVGGDRPELPPRRVPPRVDLAVRLVAGLGWPAGGGL